MQKTSRFSLTAAEEEDGLRLDKFLAQMVPAPSRSYLARQVRSGNVLVNGVRKKPASCIRAGDTIDVCLPPPVLPCARPQDIALDILYEDEDIIVVNKPAGLVVHPGAGHFDGTLVNALLYHCGGRLSGVGGVLRPGIVHRLDKNTSGCITAAKTDRAHKSLALQFQNREVRKEYIALVKDTPAEHEGVLSEMIGRHPVDRKRMAVRYDTGRQAVTQYRVLEKFGCASLLSLRIFTGRTHQIRVQMAHMGHPVIGDSKYGKRRAVIKAADAKRQMLHSYKMAFVHPAKNTFVEFTAPLPEDMEMVLACLRKRQY